MNINTTEKQIKDIVQEQFKILLTNIEKDFSKNYKKKWYNFLLMPLSDDIIAHMVFVSSFESKSGNAIETCAKRIAELRYGKENVPSIVNPRKLNNNLNPNEIKGQIIVTDVDIEDGELKGKISEFRACNEGSGSGKNKTKSKVNQRSISELLSISDNFKKNGMLYQKPVDLAFYDGTDWNLIEIKAGGNLDSSNAPSNIEKLFAIYAGLHVENAKVCFATLYNKDGEGNEWNSSVKKHMSYPEMFLIGSEFWNKILPEEIDFLKFTEIYKTALVELKLDARMHNLINKAKK